MPQFLPSKEGQTAFQIEVESGDGVEVEPLSEAQVAMLHAMAAKVHAKANCNNDDEVDMETMRLFFRQVRTIFSASPSFAPVLTPLPFTRPGSTAR